MKKLAVVFAFVLVASMLFSSMPAHTSCTWYRSQPDSVGLCAIR